MNISATVILDKAYSSYIGGIKAQIWTDIDSPGDWYAVNMDAFEVHSNKEGYVFKFTGAITPSAMGDYYYKVRFFVKENGRYIYLPQRYGNDIRITVDKPDLEDAPQSIPILDIGIINHQIDSAA